MAKRDEIQAILDEQDLWDSEQSKISAEETFSRLCWLYAWKERAQRDKIIGTSAAVLAPLLFAFIVFLKSGFWAAAFAALAILVIELLIGLFIYLFFVPSQIVKDALGDLDAARNQIKEDKTKLHTLGDIARRLEQDRLDTAANLSDLETQLHAAKTELREARDKIADLKQRPQLAGRILCLTPEIHHHESEPSGNFGDCWFTMSVNLWNDSDVATTVTGFRFYADWKGTEWPSQHIEGLEKFRAKSFRPSDPGSLQRYADEYENLFDFPLSREITATNSQRGWLRFVIRNFPLEKNQRLRSDVVIRLVALDKRGDPHTIHKGLLPNGLCPPIEKRPTFAETSELEIAFDENRGEYVNTTIMVINGERRPCKLYRVSVMHHSKSTVAELNAEQVTVFGPPSRTYHPLHLRVTGKDDSVKLARLNPKTKVFWDVIEKEDSQQEWVRLMQTDEASGILQKIGHSTFRITASCDEGLPITKLVTLGRKEDGELDFRLTDA